MRIADVKSLAIIPKRFLYLYAERIFPALLICLLFIFFFTHIIYLEQNSQSSFLTNILRVFVFPFLCLLTTCTYLISTRKSWKYSLSLSEGIKLLLLASILYLCILTVLKYLRFTELNYALFDAGIYLNRVFLTSAQNSILDAIYFSSFTTHFQPIILIPSFLVSITGDIFAVFLYQSILFALSSFIVFIIAAHYFKNYFISLIVSLIFLLAPALSFFDILGFHPEGAAIPVLLLSYLLFVKEKIKLSLLAICGLILINETLILTTISFVIYVFLHTEKKLPIKWILLISALTISTLAIKFSNSTSITYLTSFAHFVSQSPYSYLFNGTIFEYISLKIIFEKMQFLFLIFAPFLFLCLFRLKILAIGVFEFLKLLLSSEPLHYSIEGHYHAVIFTLCCIAFIESMNSAPFNYGQIRNSQVSLCALAVTFGLSIGHSPLPWSYNFVTNASGGEFNYSKYQQSEKTSSLSMIETLMQEYEVDGVSITNNAFSPLFAQERKLLLFPDLGKPKVSVVVIENGKNIFGGGNIEAISYNKSVLEALEEIQTDYKIVFKNEWYSFYAKKH